MHGLPSGSAHLLLLLSSLSILSLSLVRAEDPCTARDGTRFYDLNPLRAKTDFEVPSTGDRTLMLNVCGPIVSETWNLDEAETVGGYYRGAHADLSIGRTNSTLSIVDDSPLLIYTGGSLCGSSDGALKRSTAIRFICDQTVFSRGTPRLVAQLPTEDDDACAFLVEWRTHIACPSALPGGSGGPIVVFATIVFIAFLVYITAATAYNRMVLGLRGWDQIPRMSLFSFSDARDFVYRCRSRNRSRGYEEPPNWGSWGRDGGAAGPLLGREEDDEEAGIDGRFSLDEDDERDNQPLRSVTPPPLVGGDGIIRLS